MYQAVNTICEEALDAEEKSPTFQEVATDARFTFDIPPFPSRIFAPDPDQPSSSTDRNRTVDEISPSKRVHSDSDSNTNTKRARKSAIATALKSSPKSGGLLRFGWKKATKEEKEEQDNEEWDELQENKDNIEHEKRLTGKQKKDKERIDARARKQKQRERAKAKAIASGERSPGGTKHKVWFEIS